DLLYRRRQLRIAAPRYEDVRAFGHKPPRRRKANAAIATRDERYFSFELAHECPLMLPGRLVPRGGRRSRRRRPRSPCRSRSTHHPLSCVVAHVDSRRNPPWPAELLDAEILPLPCE